MAAAIPPIKPPGFRNLQPRAAAALDFNDDSDDDDLDGFGGTGGSLLSADYKAQRRTTQDLVDFFKSGPPPSPPRPTILPQIEEEKTKKRGLFQRLKPRKSGSSLNEKSRNNKVANATLGGSLNLGNSSGGGPGGFGSSRRTSVLISPQIGGPGAGSTLSGASKNNNNSNNNRDSFTSTNTSNQKKYVMIAVDYKNVEGGAGLGGSTALASGASSLNSPTRRTTANGTIFGASTPKRQSRIVEENTDGSKRVSLLSSSILVMDDANNGGNDNKRRSIIIQSGADGKFVLDSAPFLIDNFALNTDFITQTTGTAASPNASNGNDDLQRSGTVVTKSSGTETNEELLRNGSKRGSSKVKFSIANQTGPMDEATVSGALAQRLAAHKAQQQLPGAALLEEPKQEDIVLPTPVARKRVRHVQIQTQHCVMRPMYTQTEPLEGMDAESKDWSNVSVSGTTEIGTSTSLNATTSPVSPTPSTTTSTKKDGSIGRHNSKVASLVASLTQPTAATTATTNATIARSAANASSVSTATSTMTTTTSTSTSTDATQKINTVASTVDLSNADVATLHAELLILRNQNSVLQTQVSTLERHLSAETRARTRTAVAMQDTRDKFEMLSAMAYKKLKEMIFQRHVLELEVRELRAQVDLNLPLNSGNVEPTEEESHIIREGERLFLQQQQQQLQASA
ncbi:hypothetical protein BGZ83_006257 [Gryganskiella cystojenkinii]|nr:hypothetical protein BGZ83_006257 [Gryganskiella cystojenkinii]